METLENFGGHVEFNSQSLGDGDSNALYMPPKRMKKRKGMEQERGKAQPNKKQKLSKARKRKLKKSEDDKEKQIMLQKALKTLNENTLPVYAYPLLRSSCNINRATMNTEGRVVGRRLLILGLRGNVIFKS